MRIENEWMRSYIQHIQFRSITKFLNIGYRMFARVIVTMPIHITNNEMPFNSKMISRNENGYEIEIE